MDKEKEIVFEVKFNEKLQSVFLNDYRVGGCKWNDIDNGQEIKLSIKAEDLFNELKKTERFKKYISQSVKCFAERTVGILDKMGMERSSEYKDGYNDGVADCITNIKSCFNELYGEKL